MSRAKAVAGQVAALLARHNLEIGELAKRVKRLGGDPVTVRRVAEGEAKTEPRPKTLRLIAQAVGETKEQAFPEDSEAPGPDPTIVYPEEGSALALKVLDSSMPRELVAEVLTYLRYINRRWREGDLPGEPIPGHWHPAERSFVTGADDGMPADAPHTQSRVEHAKEHPSAKKHGPPRGQRRG